MKRPSSPQSWVALCLALLLAAPVGLLHARGAEDDRCEQRLSPHDPSAHHVTAARDVSHRSDHCVLCHGVHSLRLVRACSTAADASGGDARVSADTSHIILRRNHLSFIKDFVPEMGRNFKLIYSVRF